MKLYKYLRRHSNRLATVMFRGTPCTFFGKFLGKTTETDDLKNNGAKKKFKKEHFYL